MRTSLTLFLILIFIPLFAQSTSEEINNDRKILNERMDYNSIQHQELKYPIGSAKPYDRESKRKLKKNLVNGFLLTERIDQKWDSTGWTNIGLWSIYGTQWSVYRYGDSGGRHFYFYNENNYMTEELWQDWDGTSWQIYCKNTYTYDANNNLIEDLKEDWNNSSWVNDKKDTYIYDANSNLIEHLYQPWVDSKLVNWWKHTYAYDANNNMIEDLWQGWNSGWYNWIKRTYTYDANNTMIEHLWQLWNWDNSRWEKAYRNTYTYNANNNMVEDLRQDWDDSSWVDWWKHTYTYDTNNNMIEDFLQNLNVSDWGNNDKHTFTYDENNNMIEDLYHDLYDSTSVRMVKHTYTYDLNNNMIEDLYQRWDNLGWLNDYSILYTYQSITNIEQFEELIESYSLSNNYPNPFNPSTVIKYQIPNNKSQINSNSQISNNVTLRVFDILGREVATLVNEKQKPGLYEVSWDAKNQPSGVYYYQLTSGNFAETKKMILVK